MADPSGGKLKLTKSDKKIQRKLNRAVAIAVRRSGVEVSIIPSQMVMVGNAGLMTGAHREQLQELFERYGELDDVVMIPNESFSFIVFKNVEGAVKAIADLHGMRPSNGVISSHMCLAFVKRVPQMDPYVCPKTGQLPPSAFVINDAVNEDDEKTLLSCVSWEHDCNSMLKLRRVKHFGYKFCYKTNNVHRSNPLLEGIPLQCQVLLQRFLDAGMISWMPDQLTVNEYQPGQGIPPHVDTHSAFEEEILSLSLGSATVMDFRHPNGCHYPVLLPQRSLLIMKGESRYLWSHGITPRKTDIIPITSCDSNEKISLTLMERRTRTSFTFRKIRGVPCLCKYAIHCDSQIKSSATAETDHQSIEQIYVHEVYEQIASHFSETRYKPWPLVLEFVRSLVVGSLVLDVGCGNGKYLNHSQNNYQIGCDMSLQLLSICKLNGHQVLKCNAIQLPFRSSTFDACISIAVIHHLATKERRIAAIQEMARVLHPGGKALIYVWAFEQEVSPAKSNYLKESCIQSRASSSLSMYNHDEKERATHGFLPLPVHINRTHFHQQDTFVPWTLKKKYSSHTDEVNDPKENVEIFHRYYHVFHEEELVELCNQVNVIEIMDSYYDKGNWCVLLKKL